MSQNPLARLVLFAFPLLALLLATACGGESGLYDAVYRVGFEAQPALKRARFLPSNHAQNTTI